MLAFLGFLPIILQIISAISGLVGIANGIQATTSEGYSATPWNVSWIVGPIVTSIGSFIASFLAGPTGWPQIKKAIDIVFGWVSKKLDPENRTDVDERVLAYIAEQLLTLLEKIVSQWTTSEEAKKSIASLRFAMLVDKSGAPPAAAITAIAAASEPAPVAAKKG